jgi:hypothetical protein
MLRSIGSLAVVLLDCSVFSEECNLTEGKGPASRAAEQTGQKKKKKKKK